MDHVDKIIAQWTRERPDLTLEPMALIGRISRLGQHFSRGMGKTFAKYGLNAASFDVLATLRRSGAPFRLSPGDLMATTMVSSGTMTNRIDQLAKEGLVERVKNPDDGRGFLISLTDKGFALVDGMLKDHIATQLALTADLTGDELEALSKLLQAYLSRIEDASKGS
ncbi:MarR family winged helix-turn-helix transcriptional regulator [Kordiimonas sp.]|uniref:MarR family winged helix-turn-helix transcriptional regulator n=1 Tax=Kordiimonas sp. TaxID=1970157 RepID=UPI003A8CF721